MMDTGAGRLMHILSRGFSDVFLFGFLGWSYLAVIGFGVGGNQVREISRVAEWSLCFRAIFTSYFHCCPFSSCIRAPPSSHRRDAYGLGGRHHPGASYESHTLRDGIRHAPLLRNSQNAGRAGGAGCVVPPKAHWISFLATRGTYSDHNKGYIILIDSSCVSPRTSLFSYSWTVCLPRKEPYP